MTITFAFQSSQNHVTAENVHREMPEHQLTQKQIPMEQVTQKLREQVTQNVTQGEDTQVNDMDNTLNA